MDGTDKGITFTYGGLKINAVTGQVQHVSGRPLPGIPLWQRV